MDTSSTDDARRLGRLLGFAIPDRHSVPAVPASNSVMRYAGGCEGDQHSPVPRLGGCSLKVCDVPCCSPAPQSHRLLASPTDRGSEALRFFTCMRVMPGGVYLQLSYEVFETGQERFH
eukprot:767669-Hanusia_phi.AAC.2